MQALEERAIPAALHWIGSAAAGNQWSVPANWRENAVPVSGDALIFDSTVPGFSGGGFNSVNNIAGLADLTIAFNDASGAGDFNLTGNAFGLRSSSGLAVLSTVTTGTGATIANNLKLAADTTVNVGYGSLTLAGAIDDGGGSPYALTNASTPNANLNLSASNSYRGGTFLNSGTLLVGNNNALGSGLITFAGGTLANATAFLTVPNAFVVNTPSTIGGGSFFNLSGNGVLNATLNLTNTGFLTLSGALSGPAGLNEDGFPGSTTLSGSNPNTFTGPSTITSGAITLQKSDNVNALNSPIVVTGGFETLASSSVNQLGPGAAITLVGGNLDFGNHSARAVSLNGSGTVKNIGGSFEVYGGGNQVFTGALQNNGSFTYSGNGSLTLDGASASFNGTLVAAGGTLAVSADFSGAAAQINNGVLAGTGIVRQIIATGGALNPGGAGSVGVLTVAATSQISTLNHADFQVDVSATNGADQLAMGNGALLDLGGAALSVNVLGSASGNVYTIVSSPSGGISGTFNGLTNTATLVATGRTFQINYTTSAVTLTDITPPVAAGPTTLHWIGASGNLWNVAANWRENTVPVAGDTLVFDSTGPGFSVSANGFAPVNNITGLANLTIAIIDASGAGDFNLTGSGFGLRNSAGIGILSTVSVGAGATIASNLTLAASSTTIDVALGALTLSGTIGDGGSSTLTNASTPGATLTLSAANAYQGGTVLTSGTLKVGANTSLGTGLLTFNGGTLVNATSFFMLPNPFVVSAPSTIGGGSFFNLSGDGVLNATLNLTNTGFLTLSGVLSGPAGLNEDGFPGSTTLSGPQPNTFTGPATITSGAINVQKTAGVKALMPPITVVGSLNTLTVGMDNQLNGVTAVNLVNGNLDVSLHRDTIASLNGSGTVRTGNGLGIVGGGTQVFTGAVTGAGALTYSGAGSLALDGASAAFTGTLVAAAGTLAVSANFGSAPAQVTNGVLAGNGLVKSITATGGTLSPGGPGSVGVLTTAAGGLASTVNGATFAFDVTARNGADQLVIGDGAAINLSGATLSLNIISSILGNVYTIVSSATGGINGTFAGLAENARFAAGGHTFQINYSANIVTLTDLPFSVAPATLVGGAVGAPYSQTLSIVGGTAPYSNVGVSGFDGGGTGLTAAAVHVDTAANSIAISGTPTAAGTISFTVNASDAVGAQLTRSYAIKINVATTTTLTSTPNASTGGALVTFTATVTPSPGAAGTVSFRDAGIALSGGAGVPLVGGVALLQISTLSVGTHSITAAYSGDATAGFGGSVSNPVNQVVNRAATTTTLSNLAPNPSLNTQSITLTVTVAGGAATDGESVSLIDASNGNATVAHTGGTLAAGSATITIQAGALAVGTHSLIAIYAGDGFNLGSQSSPALQVVAAQPHLLSVNVNGNIAAFAGLQRSRVASLQVVFDEPVQLDAGAFTLGLHTNNVAYNGVLQASGLGSLPASLNISSADNITWVVTFNGNTDDGADGLNSLIDGVYDLHVAAAKVHPAIAPGFHMASNATTTFYRLFGETNAPSTPAGGIADSDFEAIVNSGDNLTFRGAFNNLANYKSYLDANGDGILVTGDNLQFRTRFNKSLTWSI